MKKKVNRAIKGKKFAPGEHIRVVPLHQPAITVAPAGANLTCRGGPLIPNVEVFTIFWGNLWESSLGAHDMSKPFLGDDGTARRLLDRKQVEENALDFQRFVGALTRDRVTQLPIGKLLDVGEFIPSVSDWLHLTETTGVRLLIGKAFDVTQQI
jgi:hypothetical protein